MRRRDLLPDEVADAKEEYEAAMGVDLRFLKYARTVNGKLDMDLSSGSRLCYSGNPTMGKINVSGASTLSQR